MACIVICIHVISQLACKLNRVIHQAVATIRFLHNAMWAIHGFTLNQWPTHSDEIKPRPKIHTPKTRTAFNKRLKQHRHLNGKTDAAEHSEQVTYMYKTWKHSCQKNLHAIGYLTPSKIPTESRTQESVLVRRDRTYHMAIHPYIPLVSNYSEYHAIIGRQSRTLWHLVNLLANR